MKKLAYIRVIQYFFYEANEIVVGMNCGIIGANGSGKSSLLDAVQIVMLGANESRGSKGVSFNAQADEANHASRTIRSYCLGQYGETPDMRVRDRATTYITLVWHDTATLEIISTGVCIDASSERERPDILGRYIIPVDLTLDDHLERIDGEQRPRQWAGFRQMLSQRAPGEEVLYHDSDRFVSAMLFRLRGARGVPDRDAYRRAFRFGLRLKYDKSVDAIVRQHVLEARPTNINRFKDVLQTFQEMAALVRGVETKLEDAAVIQAIFADAQRRNSHAVSLAALACAAERDLANAAVKAAEAAEKEAITALEAATTRRDTRNRAVEAAEETAHASAANRDKHASHADIGLLRESLAGTQKRLGDQRTRLYRSLHAIGKAISVQIPGKLIADHADATGLARDAIAAMLKSDDVGSRADIEARVRAAVRAAKLLSNEVFEQMRSVGRAQNEA